MCVLWSSIKNVLYKTALVWTLCAKGYLFASEEFLIASAATYLSKLMQVLSIDQLNGTQSSHIAEDGNTVLLSDTSWVESTWSQSLKSGWESPFKNI